MLQTARLCDPKTFFAGKADQGAVLVDNDLPRAVLHVVAVASRTNARSPYFSTVALARMILAIVVPTLMRQQPESF